MNSVNTYDIMIQYCLKFRSRNLNRKNYSKTDIRKIFKSQHTFIFIVGNTVFTFLVHTDV